MGDGSLSYESEDTKRMTQQKFIAFYKLFMYYIFIIDARGANAENVAISCCTPSLPEPDNAGVGKQVQ